MITVVFALPVVVFFVAPIFAIIPVISTFAAVITVLRANGRAHGSSESQEKQTGKKSLHELSPEAASILKEYRSQEEKAVRMIQLNGQVPTTVWHQLTELPNEPAGDVANSAL